MSIHASIRIVSCKSSEKRKQNPLFLIFLIRGKSLSLHPKRDAREKKERRDDYNTKHSLSLDHPREKMKRAHTRVNRRIGQKFWMQLIHTPDFLSLSGTFQGGFVTNQKSWNSVIYTVPNKKFTHKSYALSTVYTENRVCNYLLILSIKASELIKFVASRIRVTRLTTRCSGTKYTITIVFSTLFSKSVENR